MKLRDSLSTLALALADIAQSLRVYVQHSTQRPVPLAHERGKRSVNATLLVTDDEELWKKEQSTKLASLVRSTQAELEAAELERASLEFAVSSQSAKAATSQSSQPSDEGQLSDDARASSLQESSGFSDQW